MENACDRICSVVSEGEVMPFSILDSIPMDSPVTPAKIGHRHALGAAERADRAADRHFQIALGQFAHPVRVLVERRFGARQVGFVCVNVHETGSVWDHCYPCLLP